MYCICCFLLGKYIVKDMNVYIKPLFDELVKLGNDPYGLGGRVPYLPHR